jgi:hypothetical protein
MNEKEMEDLIAKYPDDFFPHQEFVLLGRQESLAGVGRFDLLFEDRFKSTILMELKARALKYEDATQIARYRDELKRGGHEKVVMWLVAPQVPLSVRDFLDDKGIQYTEINVAEFRRVAERHDFVITSEGRHGTPQAAAEGRSNDGSADSRPASLTTVDVRDFLEMTLPSPEYVVDPFLTVRGRSMIFSPRGPEKSYFTMQLAYSVACGIPCFDWKVPRARRVVYVDGEMHDTMLQQRQKDIVLLNGGRIPEPGYLRIITCDLQKGVRPMINSPQGRALIQEHLSPDDLLILDDLSALSASSDEKETLDWAQIEDWANDLSWNGISIIFVNHSGKSGSRRGTSNREDLMDGVLRLRLPVGHKQGEVLRWEVELEKVRGRPPKLSHNRPFEIALDLGPTGKRTWMMQPLRGLLKLRAEKMLIEGVKPGDVAVDTGLKRATVYRILRRINTSGHGSETDTSAGRVAQPLQRRNNLG